MHSSFEKLFENLLHVLYLRDLPALHREPVRRAISLILLDLAFVDNEFDNREFQTIRKALEGLLEASTEEVEELILAGRKERAAGQLDYGSLATFLVKKLSVDERKKLLEVISATVFADETLHSFERALRDRYERLLFPKKK